MQELTIKQLHGKGKSIEDIVIATGCHLIAVCKLLGLPVEGKEYEKTKLNLENRKKI